MCAWIFTVIYGILAAAAGVLNIVALSTKNWATGTNGTMLDSLEESWSIFGGCIMDPKHSECQNSWETGNAYQKATFICLIASICLCALAVVWSVVSAIACCCTRCLLPPLSVFALFGCASVTAALIAYGINVPKDFKIGYSMWFGILAAVLLLINTILSSVVVWCTRKGKMERRGRVPPRTWVVAP